VKKQQTLLWDSLHLLVLASFAIAQPLYDLLGSNAEFFVAHRSDPPDLITLTGLVSLGIPLGLIFVRGIAGAIHRRLGGLIQSLAVTALTTLILLPPLKQLENLSGDTQIGLAGGIGIAFILFYWRFHLVRQYLSFLSPAALIFPLLFLFHSPVSKLLSAPEQVDSTLPVIGKKAPIVILLLDELPTFSLLGEQRRINPARYPHFAALAKEAY
jgi:hypothetical protein